MLDKIQRVGFLGIGISNISLMELDRFKKCKITLRSSIPFDLHALPSGLDIERILIGNDQLADINEDVLFLSPSVRRDAPELLLAMKRGVTLCSDAELFFDENSSPVYAVTGSDGKSTTATLTHLLLSEAGEKAVLIGNIGEPMAKNLGRYKSYVTELSSFMLEQVELRSVRACITNITPNHLDFHGSFEKYREAKMKILKNAEEWVLPEEIGEGFAVIGENLSDLKKKRKAEVYITCDDGYIRRNGKRLIGLDIIKRNEPHNIKNLMMAIGMTDGKVGRDEIIKVARSFNGLPHRCELIISRRGVDFYDSSIDSTPKRTVQTLLSLNKRCVLLLGGRSKGLDYSVMKNELDRYAEKIIICGENAEEIFDAIGRKDAIVKDNFDDAVIYGIELSKAIGRLLLSPASTSYDSFKNYAERGDRFKEIILKNL